MLEINYEQPGDGADWCPMGGATARQGQRMGGYERPHAAPEEMPLWAWRGGLYVAAARVYRREGLRVEILNGSFLSFIIRFTKG